MATPKKKHLIELMIEAGVKWPDCAEYAAQDKRTLNVNFYRNGKPDFQSGYREWMANDCCFMGNYAVELDSLCRNWDQTIVTREQYAEALAANVGEPAVMQHKSNQVRESRDYPAVADVGCFAWDNQPSVEQLTADYHAKAAEADSLQAVADEALKAADDALLALEKAGELIGLVISIDTKPKQVGQPEITDWRDLRVGDVIIIDYVDVEPVRKNALEGVESVIVSDGDEYPVCATNENYPNGESFNMGGMREKRWRFIRRP